MWRIVSSKDADIRACLTPILEKHSGKRVEGDRRGDLRAHFPARVRLFPICPSTLENDRPPLDVLGKQLSERGLDFYSDQPLPFRYAVARLEQPGLEPVELVISLTWCRFGASGQYENGGRFTRVVTSVSASDSAEHSPYDKQLPQPSLARAM